MTRITLSVQLERAQAELEAAVEKVAKLTKEADSAKTSREYSSKQLTEAQAQIEQVNSLLDAMPGAGPRRTKNVNEEAYFHPRDLDLMTRLAVYLANRG